MKKFLTAGLIAGLLVGSQVVRAFTEDPATDRIREAFARESIILTGQQINLIRRNVELAVKDICQFQATGNSRVNFAAVEIASDLKLNPQTDGSVVNRVMNALNHVSRNQGRCMPEVMLGWEDYFNKTISLNSNSDFLSLLAEKAFHPVKISWEDIGRYENSVWGDRISDVGIWVRKDEDDPQSAQLALSVRRDSNFRDKVLVVPADQIKVHTKQGDRTVETNLPERLKQLGLASPERDRNVIVSNQFAIVPVPAKGMTSASDRNHPPRSAFNFSIYPYGSTNFVITDVIEGSSNAIVGPGQHQMLYANVNGQKAPFTASRAEDRQDLMKLEADLKAKGMDVDVQRYYLIQIPLKRDANIELSNMGTPPMQHFNTMQDFAVGGAQTGAPAPTAAMEDAMYKQSAAPAKRGPGLTKVAIGHGEVEGRYSEGGGYRGQRADEPIRVTVVYFVTPIGEVSEADMKTFTKTFESWDKQALWSGSFVVKE